MTIRTRPARLGRGLVVGAAALALVLAACGSDDDDDAGGGASTTAGGSTETSAGGTADLSGKTVKVLGTEVGTEADGVIAGWVPFEESSGATIEYSGTRDAETQVRTAAEGGTGHMLAAVTHVFVKGADGRWRASHLHRSWASPK